MQAGKRALAGAIAVAAVLSAPAWGGSIEEISVTDAQDDSFQPKRVESSVGDGSIVWKWDPNNENDHNVIQDRRLFRSGEPDPVDEDFAVDPSAGTFGYYCVVHGDDDSGMRGKLRIAPSLETIRRQGPIDSFEVRWATANLDSGDRFDVHYRVGDGKWKAWKRNSSKIEGEFGADDKPLNVKPNRIYSFRARSKDSDNLKRRSGWSPVVGVGFAP
jgi:plastocyanin